MTKLNKILTENQYYKSLLRVDKLLDADSNDLHDNELDQLVDLIINYEDLHFPMGKEEQGLYMKENIYDSVFSQIEKAFREGHNHSPSRYFGYQ